jgi:hypothetical protein
MSSFSPYIAFIIGRYRAPYIGIIIGTLESLYIASIIHSIGGTFSTFLNGPFIGPPKLCACTFSTYVDTP